MRRVEGLQALPWLHEARADDPTFLDCDHCMKHNDYEIRRRMACGYIPADEHLRGMKWQPDPDSGIELTVCAGYSTSLPDVIDVARAYHHWKAGALRDVTGDQPPCPALLDCLTLLESTVLTKQRVEHAKAAKTNKGGR